MFLKTEPIKPSFAGAEPEAVVSVLLRTPPPCDDVSGSARFLLLIDDLSPGEALCIEATSEPSM
jgi:hypothetical protein